MSASTVISDITHTLEELLKSEQQPPNSFDVSLKSPSEEIGQQRPKVNLFLYRIAEDPFARNQERQPIGLNALEYPALWLNAFFLLTPFAEHKLDELSVLGEAMRVLHDNSVITRSALKGPSLEHTNEEVHVSLCQFSLEQLAQIWNALDEPYRLSVCYEVRTVFIDSLIQTPVSRVLDIDNRFSQL
jgi:Pvc16 N-terminal domain